MRVMRDICAMLLTLACLSTSAFATPAGASSDRGEHLSLRWRAPVIRLAISNSLLRPGSNIKADSDVSGAIKRSLAAWSDVAEVEFASVESDRQSISPSGVAGDGVSLITIAQTPENVMLFSRDPSGESARTRVFYNRIGTITEADIVLNPFLQFSTDGTFGTFDLESTLTHEIGHLLGIRHSGVIGSAMSESLARNNETSTLNGPRKLATSDIASVRQKYGASNAEDCCASVTGKLAARSANGIAVWAEENGTGRVSAWTETATDGSFELGGMPSGSYSLLWRRSDGNSNSTIGYLGMIRLHAGDTSSVSQKLEPVDAGEELLFVGLNSQLTDSSITLEAGREHIVFLGGTAVDRQGLVVEFNSPFLTVVPGTIRPHDFGDDLSVISFVLRISPEAPPGLYSIFATREDSISAALPGAVTVR